MGTACSKCSEPQADNEQVEVTPEDSQVEDLREDARKTDLGSTNVPESVAVEELQLQMEGEEKGLEAEEADVKADVEDDHDDSLRGTAMLRRAKLVNLDLRVMYSQDCDFIDPKTREKNRQGLERRSLHGEASMKVITVPHTFADYEDSASPRGFKLAQGIVARAKGMAADTAEEPLNITHNNWKGPNGKDALPQLLGTDKQIKEVVSLMDLNKKILVCLKEDPILMRVPSPAQVYGDLHGQFRDLLLFLHHYGFPSMESPCFIFNGDWVDRGHHQIETVTLVFALKLAFPEKVFLVRGNHEDWSVNKHMGSDGFDHALTEAFGDIKGPALFTAFSRTFDMLPCAALIDERILVVHGGIGDGNWTFGDLEELNSVRPITHEFMESNSLVYNILWSDPVDEDRGPSFGVHDSPRDHHKGQLHNFSKAITESFCRKNDIAMVIRSHEFEQQGAGYEIMHGGMLVTVFSARDYEDMHNDGAILSIAEYENNPEHCGAFGEAMYSNLKMLVVRPQQIWSHKKTHRKEMEQ